MRLAIADPPYLGRAAVWYGDGMGRTQLSPEHGGTSRKRGIRPADHHPDAGAWDDPETHRRMVEMLTQKYDGWAIAMAHDNLRAYMPWVPSTTRIGIWVKTQNLCGGARVINSWEPALVYIPEGRRSSTGHTLFPKDSIVTQRDNAGFAGSKPATWTRWVLDMLGYDAETDTVDDLFGGSGAVSREIAQGVMSFGEAVS